MMKDRDLIIHRIQNSLKGISKNELAPTHSYQNKVEQKFLIEKMKNEWERNGSIFHDFTQTTDLSKDFFSYLNSSFQRKRVAISDLIKELINFDHFKKANFEFIESQCELATADVSICVATVGIAENGTIVVHWEEKQSRAIALLPEWVVFLLPQSKLVETMDEAFQEMRTQNHKGWVMIAGPSRTADIEKVLITGVHGPKFVSLLIVQ